MRALTSSKYRGARAKQKFENQNLLNRSYIPNEHSLNYGNVSFAQAQQTHCKKLATPKISKPKRSKTMVVKWR